jgi:peptidoglycan/LPS O-acetylase OafA/YrhL
LACEFLEGGRKWQRDKDLLKGEPPLSLPGNAMSTPSERYRPDIDGLRAIAVMLVVNFHAFPDAMRGGFIGVDIFFVISGFLITGIIARELSETRFSLVGFYVRRIRRIFPALIAVLAAVLVLGWLWMLPHAYAQLSSDVFASAAFAANIALMLQSGYFDVESAKKPLLHLWSLGIEEQFYLAWPLILMLASRWRVGLLSIAGAIAIASFTFNVARIDFDPVATFYLPFPRAWELLAGAVLALRWSRIDQSEAASNWRAAAGIVLIVIAAAVLNVHRAFPGWWALLPVAGSALLLSAPASWINRTLLSWPPMVWIGLISYPLYLWHWPLLVFPAIVKFEPLTLVDRELALLASAVLAWGTYVLIEKPLRFGQRRGLKAAGLGAAMAAVAFAGIIVYAGRGFDVRLPPEIRGMADVPEQNAQWRVAKCLIDLSYQTNFADECAERNRRPLLLLWGDSTAGALMPGLFKAQATRNFGIAQFTASACVPVLNVDIAVTPNCRANNERVLATAIKLKPDIILLHGTWEKNLDRVGATIAALRRETQARVVVLGRDVVWKRGLPNEVLRHYLLHHELIPARSSDAVVPRSIDRELRDAVVHEGGEFISGLDVLCNDEGCLTRLGDQVSDITASDQVHLTEKASVFLVQGIIDRLLGASVPGDRVGPAAAVVPVPEQPAATEPDIVRSLLRVCDSFKRAASRDRCRRRISRLLTSIRQTPQDRPQ